MRVVIIGAGPSADLSKLELNKNDELIICDSMLIECIKYNLLDKVAKIIVCTLEDNIKSHYFEDLRIADYPIKLIISERTLMNTVVTAVKYGIEVIERWGDNELNNTSNVGLMCWLYAFKTHDSSTPIFLVGFDSLHRPTNERELRWKKDFEDMSKKYQTNTKVL